MKDTDDFIKVRGARVHNLKNINVEIPKNKLVIFTGVSGSGKTSLAMDTLFAEGQRRYVESLSSYARQFLGMMAKPDIDSIIGLSPSIAIDQKNLSSNPRSTVGTITEIYDYLRLLYARIGHPHCPKCQREISPMSKEEIFEKTKELIKKRGEKGVGFLKIMVLAPIVKGRKGEFKELFSNLEKKGILRLRIDGRVYGVKEDLVLIKTNKHNIEAVIDRMVVPKEFIKGKKGFMKTDFEKRLMESLEAGLKMADGEVIISFIKDSGFEMIEKPKEMEDFLFSEKLACGKCGVYMERLEPRSFSFNSPYGACEMCGGLGKIKKIDEELILNRELSIMEGGLMPYGAIVNSDTWFMRTLKNVAEEEGINLNTAIKNLTRKEIDKILWGVKGKLYQVKGKNRFGRMTAITTRWEGILERLEEKYAKTESEYIRKGIEKYMREKRCALCKGKRLKKEALSVVIDGKSIADVSEMTVEKFWQFLVSFEKKAKEKGKERIISEPIVKELKKRTRFLIDVGLNYLTLSRKANTLAAGEGQRIRLASQIGSGLSGVLYILDEPSIGLHARDNYRLIKTLKKLRDLKNTVIVVEHDKKMIESADYIFDFGPGAGEHGGRVISRGSLEEIKKDKNSITGKFLTGKRKIPEVEKNGGFDQLESLTIKGAREHNLKNIDVSFPLKKFICITGVSGSGKSTLINDVLYQAMAKIINSHYSKKPGDFEEIIGANYFDKVVMIDQSPIGRTPRSNPATYTGVFTYIRELFAQTKEARVRGFKKGSFSFNVKGGRCEACQGEGEVKIEMQFLPAIYVPCEVCKGKRYNFSVLDVYYKGKNIADVLGMSVGKAGEFFENISALERRLKILEEVGLSYIKLGQPAPTLSGGEAQRLKLAAELGKKSTGNTLYLLDEPTTGLHFADLLKLIKVLKKLVSKGNTVIVIEHNLDIIKNADYIIDLGPEGGDKGGEVVFKGTVGEILKATGSKTGVYLKKHLKND